MTLSKGAAPDGARKAVKAARRTPRIHSDDGDTVPLATTDNNSDNNDSNDNATVAKDGFLATLAALRNGLKRRSTDVVVRDRVPVRDASSASDRLRRASRRAREALRTRAAAHEVLVAALRREAAGERDRAVADRRAWEARVAESDTRAATAEARAEKRAENAHREELARQAIVTIARHLRFRRDTERAREAGVRAVRRVRERATAEIAREQDSAQRRLAEAVRAAVSRADTAERDLARVETEKQAWVSRATGAEETLKTLEEERETCQQLRTELEESKRKERALAERALGLEKEIEVVKAAMVDLQQTLTDNTCALDARHISLKETATRQKKELEKLMSLVEVSQAKVEQADREREDAMRRTEELRTIVDKVRRERDLGSQTFNEVRATSERTVETLTHERDNARTACEAVEADFASSVKMSRSEACAACDVVLADAVRELEAVAELHRSVAKEVRDKDNGATTEKTETMHQDEDDDDVKQRRRCNAALEASRDLIRELERRKAEVQRRLEVIATAAEDDEEDEDEAENLRDELITLNKELEVQRAEVTWLSSSRKEGGGGDYEAHGATKDVDVETDLRRKLKDAVERIAALESVGPRGLAAVCRLQDKCRELRSHLGKEQMSSATMEKEAEVNLTRKTPEGGKHERPQKMPRRS